jgi:hypothetical protein
MCALDEGPDKGAVEDCGEVRGDEKVVTSLARRTLAFAPALCCCAAKVKGDGQR